MRKETSPNGTVAVSGDGSRAQLARRLEELRAQREEARREFLEAQKRLRELLRSGPRGS
jgi:hypothetical protein